MTQSEIEGILQEIAEDLAELAPIVIASDNPYTGMGYVKNIGTLVKILADGMDLDVVMLTPID